MTKVHYIIAGELASLAMTCGGVESPEATAPTAASAVETDSKVKESTKDEQTDNGSGTKADNEPTVGLSLHAFACGPHKIHVLNNAVVVQFGKTLGVIRNGEFKKRDDLSKKDHDFSSYARSNQCPRGLAGLGIRG